MRKRIVDIGDVAELEELGDADMDAVGEDYGPPDNYAGASHGGFVAGALLGGLLGVGLGAAVAAHHFRGTRR